MPNAHDVAAILGDQGGEVSEQPRPVGGKHAEADWLGHGDSLREERVSQNALASKWDPVLARIWYGRD
jgi:hypothetical protein